MLKKLKNIFVVEDETFVEEQTKGEAPAKAASDNKAAPKPANVPKSRVDKATPNAAVKPDRKFVDLLLKAIEDNNLEGFDYLEFKQSVQSLTKVESDEAKRYQSAFAMAGAMGLTKSNLFSSAKHYAGILDAEEKKFAEAFNGQRQKQINERETKGKQLEQSIKDKEAQIKKLQADIEKEKKQLSNIESDISKAMAKVEATKEGFYSAYHMVLKQIKDDLDKITNYIK